MLGKNNYFGNKITIALLSILLAQVGCRQPNQEPRTGMYFTEIKASRSHIDFNNKLVENDSTNFIINQYIYIGSGVGTGDFNNDGLQDLFFAGAQVPSRLYINKGNLEFEDVTEKSGLLNTKWCTGVSIVDINLDGLQDIYVCVTNASTEAGRRNQLFINKGNLNFSEEAKAYGLDDPGYSTQAAFFDQDLDGDLDMYLMNHNVFHDEPNNFIQDTKGNRMATDKFYRNEGVPSGGSHPVFRDDSEAAGVKDVAYGLGLAVSDLNTDGWPDLYIGNDFISNDLMWLNDQRGGFTNFISRSLRHQSYNSMGVDIADLNNDLLPEIAVLDMQPETNYRKKIMFAGANPERYEMEQKMGGYQPQFARNMLQLNHGNRMYDSIAIPFFSEIGNYTGLAETDWSWSVLLADLDNDGLKDVHITNGLAKDLTNNDFLFFRHGRHQVMTGAESNPNNDTTRLIKELDSYGEVRIHNYLFRNSGDLRFENATSSSGLSSPSISQGAVQVDLDNDGDLDLVVNNMNQPAFLWRNEIRQSVTDSTANFLSLQLKGSDRNPSGFGAKVYCYSGSQVQYLEQYPVRGYLSSVDQRLHFGLGPAKTVDSVRILWPGNKEQVIRNQKANQFLTLRIDDAVPVSRVEKHQQPVFREDKNAITFKHHENSYFDFGRQKLIPQKYSQLGPAISVADVNGDGLDDVFAGGGAYQMGQIFIQDKEGNFSGSNLEAGEKSGEDAASVFLDVDGDKDPDLLVMSGSSEYGNSTSLNIPKIYLNDGKGQFQYFRDAFPSNVATLSQAICVSDYDGDGDPDLFIGGRMIPDQYPLPARSFLLRNDRGRFVDVTQETCKELVQPGLVTAAEWADLDADGLDDLVICGDWMPIRFFMNRNGKLTEQKNNVLDQTNWNGMWRALKIVDLDQDGDQDILAGNIGQNNKWRVSAQRPMKLFANDFDHNGSIDMIPAYYIKNNKGELELYPGIDRTQFSEEMLFIKKKYLLNESFAKADMQEILGILDKKGMLEFTWHTASSCWLENTGKGNFRLHELPKEAQLAPINAIETIDVDQDGRLDLVIGGNEYQAEVSAGRYDASYGLILRGMADRSFEPIPPVASGFILDGNVKHIRKISGKKTVTSLLVAVNNDSLRLFR